MKIPSKDFRFLGFVVLVGAALLTMPSMASAADPSDKIKVLDFEEDVIAGELQMPNGDRTVGLPGEGLLDLVRSRGSFEEKIVQSVDRL